MMWMDTPGFYMLSQLMSSKSTMRSENCLHSSKTGLNWGTDLRIQKKEKICCTKGSQEHRGLHPSERFGRAMTQSWLSIQGEKDLCKGCNQETDGGPGWAPEGLCADGGRFQEVRCRCHKTLINGVLHSGLTEEASQERLAKKHPNDFQTVRTWSIGSDETKVDLCGLDFNGHLWWKIKNCFISGSAASLRWSQVVAALN